MYYITHQIIKKMKREDYIIIEEIKEQRTLGVGGGYERMAGLVFGALIRAPLTQQTKKE